LENQIYNALGEEPLVWGMFYCPNHFRSQSPPFHTTILDGALKNRYFAVASPRESAKSTILAFLLPTHSIVYKKKRFIVIVSNTYTKAATSLETIKKELKDNELVNKTFKIELVRDTVGDSVFRHPDGFETRVLCKGAEQIGSIRGEKFGAYRPDMIIGDDIEDDELVRNPDRRRALNDVFDEALIPAGDKEKCDYIFIGTILHDDSQMAKLVSPNYYPEYTKIIYKALNVRDGEQVSLWKEKWSVEDLLKLQKEKPSVFAKEYQNDPVAGLMGKFKKEDFRYWARENNEYVLFDDTGRIIQRDRFDTCRGAVACDLAWEEKRESDFSVILPGYLTQNSYLLIDDYICKKGMRPHEIEEILFNLDTRLKAETGATVYFGFEKAKLEKVIKFLLRQEMSKRNHWLNFKDLVWDTDKVQRITTRLEPRYAMHTVFHKRNMGDLEHQLLRFPSGAHDDLPDAEQGLVQLLQYPKGRVSPKPKQDAFNWWRDRAIESKTPKLSQYLYGSKINRKYKIPFKQGFD
jgi:hypothetical protein